MPAGLRVDTHEPIRYDLPGFFPKRENLIMCMDTGPFELAFNDEITPLAEAASIVQTDQGLVLIDLLGNKQPLQGTLAEIDLLNRRIVLK